ncbi:MAG TPA: hypothetical protein VHM70_22840 [Polyangiaceae bacterium]|jgi:hypothetical protein|nr:hypothetical protein [Polyangiaceae bacterium]
MHDENAFGIWIANTYVEDDEYGRDDLAEFVDRLSLFRRLVLQYVGENPLGAGGFALDLGHGLYLEVAEEGTSGLLAWGKKLRTELSEHDFDSTLVVTHGGRWVDEGVAAVELGSLANLQLATLRGPSEPLRRALFAETASHGLPDEDAAWGPGFYLDTEAAEALGVKPKNAPTLLEVAGAQYFRVSR